MSASALFDEGFDAQRVLMGLSLATRREIKPGSTLIVLDEIQTNPRAITAFKYFCEELPAYAVAAAGSLLGLSAREGSGYPVGKVETLNLHPLSFREYLDATGDRPLRLLLDSQDTQTMAAFSEREVLALKTYYLVGGMPAVVNEYVESEDFAQVRALQNRILEDYARDFAKHMPMRLLPKALDAWRSIPAHLSHENKKFVFGRIREGARAKDFEDALIWLQQAGLISRVPRVKKPALSLSAYDDRKAFKVFLLDVGLLGAMSGVDAAGIVQGSGIFTEFKGSLTEAVRVPTADFRLRRWALLLVGRELDGGDRLPCARPGGGVRNGGQGGREPARKKPARVQAGESAGESRALLALALPPARLDAQRPALRRREQEAVELAERCALRANRAAK